MVVVTEWRSCAERLWRRRAPIARLLLILGLTPIGLVTFGSSALTAPVPSADPKVSTVTVEPQGDGALAVTVHLRDSAGNPTTTLDRPWLIIKAVRPPYSGPLGVYTTGPSQVDGVSLVSGGTLGSDHGPGVLWITPTSPDVAALVRPGAAGAPSVVAWIVDAQGNGVPIGLGATPTATTAPPTVAPPTPVPTVAATVAVAAPVAPSPEPSPATDGPPWWPIALVPLAAAAAAAIAFLRPRPTSTSSVLVTYEGNPQIIRAGAAGPVPLDTQVVSVGDRLIMDATSRATLVYADGSTVALDPNTEVGVKALDVRPDYSATDLMQYSGRVTSTLQKLFGPSHFNIRTPSIAVGVRGTRFVTEVMADGTSTVTVEEGQVEVTGLDHRVFVNAGEQVVVHVGEIPTAPSKISLS